MTIIESIRNYISRCPNLKTFDNILKVYVDFQKSDEVTTYSIEESVAQHILKKYIDGSSERQFVFTFSSVEFYGSDVQINIDNSGFYEEFSQWLEDNSKLKILPVMDTGKQALKIEALTNGYLFNNAANGTTARYQIQCKLTYFQKNNYKKG